MNDKNRLDEILESRAFEKPQDDFVDRIIMAAQNTPQKQPQRKRKIEEMLWNSFSGMFVLPQPAVAMAACLVLGIYLGFEAEILGTLFQDDLSSFFYVEEVWS